MSPETPVRKVFDKPSFSDGHKHYFDCCPSPNVWRYTDSQKRCRVCGYNWTGELQSD